MSFGVQQEDFGASACRDHCQRSLPSQISDRPQTGMEPVQNLGSGLVE